MSEPLAEMMNCVVPAPTPAWWYQSTEVATGAITNWNTRPGIEGKRLWLNLDSVRDPSLQVPVLHVEGCFHARNVLTHSWWQEVPAVILPSLIAGEKLIWDQGIRPRNLTFCYSHCLLEKPYQIK